MPLVLPIAALKCQDLMSGPLSPFLKNQDDYVPVESMKRLSILRIKAVLVK